MLACMRARRGNAWLGYLAGALLWAMMAGSVRADSIRVEGKVYTGVKIIESSTRYYFRDSDGTSISVGKSEIAPNDIRLGEGPLPEPAPERPAPVKETPPAPEPPKAPEPAPVPVTPPAPEPPKAPEPAPVPVTPPAPEPPKAPEPAPVPVTPPAPEPPKVPEPAPVPVTPPAPEPPKAPEPAPVPVTPPTPELPKAPELAPMPEAPAVPEPPALEPLPLAKDLRASALRAGAARVTVSDSSDPLGVLEVDAVVVRNESAALAFCSMDTAALGGLLTARVLAKLAERGSGLDPRGVWISPTGADTGRYRGIMRGAVQEAVWGAFDEKVLDEAAGHAADAIAQAEKALKPARLRMGEAEVPEGHSPRSGGSITADSTLTALAVETLEGAPLAYLVNYAIYPLPGFGRAPVAQRGVPGALTDALRAKAGAETPVVFLNGAAGDVSPALSEGEAALGAHLAEVALSALDAEPPRKKAALGCVVNTVPLPPSLLDGLVPEAAALQSARIDETVFLAMPGLPSAQIGLLLRVKAITQGADHVFLAAQTGDALGYQPGIEEFFAVTDQAQSCFHGPLMVLWYGENHLPGADDAAEPVWENVPALDRFASGFGAARERGRAEAEAIARAWEETAAALEASGQGLRGLAGDLSPELQTLLARVSADEAGGLLLQALSLRCRRDFAELSEEQRVILMGVAQGAEIPFDALLLLQTFSLPERLPADLQGAVKKLGVRGGDYLATPGR